MFPKKSLWISLMMKRLKLFMHKINSNKEMEYKLIHILELVYLEKNKNKQENNQELLKSKILFTNQNKRLLKDQLKRIFHQVEGEF